MTNQTPTTEPVNPFASHRFIKDLATELHDALDNINCEVNSEVASSDDPDYEFLDAQYVLALEAVIAQLTPAYTLTLRDPA